MTTSPSLPKEQTAFSILRELVTHLRAHRDTLIAEWIRRISETGLLSAITKKNVFLEATRAFDNYVEALQADTTEVEEAYARRFSELFTQTNLKAYQVVGIMLLLRDAVARFLFTRYRPAGGKLNQILDLYESAANRFVTAVAALFAEERERIISEYRETMHELSVRL